MGDIDAHETTSTSLNYNSNVTMIQTNVTLVQVNDAMTVTLLPAILYVAVMMLVGFLGNSLVVYVFVFRFRKGTQNFLITFLAIFDLISCLVAMPTEIVDIRYFYMFDSAFACKLLTFVTTFCAMCSVFTLLGIAVDRYVKICRPLSNQVELKQVQIWIVVVIFLALLFSWPSLVIYGIRSADTGVPGVTGRDCSTGDHVKNTNYPLIYNLLQGAGLIIIMVVLIVLYVFILRAVKVHRRHMQLRASVSTIEMSSSNGHHAHFSDSPEGKVPHENSLKKSKSHRSRTTVIAFLVTVVFVFSFVPHLILMVTRAIVKDFDYDLRGASLVAFNIFIRSYFINSVANPIIYGALNYKFREECVWLFKKIFLCRRRPVRISRMASFSTIS